MQPSNPPPPHVSPPGMWGTKLALRILQFIMAIALIGCGGSIVSTGVWDAWAIVMIGPQAVVSAVWSLSEGICILARGGRRGIHPGANVALDLLLWLGFVAGAVLVWIVGIGDYYDYYDYRGRGVQTRAAGLGQAMIGLGSTLTWVLPPLALAPLCRVWQGESSSANSSQQHPSLHDVCYRLRRDPPAQPRELSGGRLRGGYTVSAVSSVSSVLPPKPPVRPERGRHVPADAAPADVPTTEPNWGEGLDATGKEPSGTNDKSRVG